jgi:Fic family protein
MTTKPFFNPSEPFQLPPLPPAYQISPQVDRELTEARVALEGLKASLESFEDPGHLISIPALQESVSSSNIENIRTTVEGALEDVAKEERDQQSGNKEALNYRTAIFEGFKAMKSWAITERTMLEIHRNLKVKGAGKLRNQQNSIVDEYKDPIYTPPRSSNLHQLLSNWENFVNGDDNNFHPVIKSIMAHYQFEAIHPFVDGNGRTGRILMVLQLVQDKILPIPALYISGYLNEHSIKYKNLLLEVTKTQNWENYLKFMLLGFSTQAKRTRYIISKIQRLKLEVKREIRNDLPKIYSADLINHLFSFPVTFNKLMVEELEISRSTASRHLRALEDQGTLKKKKSGKYLLFINFRLMRLLMEKPDLDL